MRQHKHLKLHFCSFSFMNDFYRSAFGVRFSLRSVSMLAFLAALPNLLGAIVMPTPLGFHFHLFQIGIFLAALLYGQWGGAVSGAFGSIFTAIALNNPFIIAGNIILGFFTGLFLKRVNIITAAMLAYAVQLPWLWYTDIFLAGMKAGAVKAVMWALLFSNLVWAAVAFLAGKKIGLRDKRWC
jgi:uncharacterized membrane protein